ncbi:hypothetical protein KPL76_03545 [Subtercola sp. PAMC28395]|nr:hypothetical protein [Subtercola sp. PAMC28395]QWT24483.1 hypothetical protein KPL76_03545 [Subtercola sp. PAMC28395]
MTGTDFGARFGLAHAAVERMLVSHLSAPRTCVPQMPVTQTPVTQTPVTQ